MVSVLIWLDKNARAAPRGYIEKRLGTDLGEPKSVGRIVGGSSQWIFKISMSLLGTEQSIGFDFLAQLGSVLTDAFCDPV